VSTVFDRIVTKENDHTHLLRNIMERHPKVAAAILRDSLNRDMSEAEANSLEFRAQFAFSGDEGREIPDILIQGEDFRCLIEAKIDPWLDLTEAQKRGYQACLNGSREGLLVFLVPSNWKYRDSAKQVHFGLSAEDVRVRVLSWRDLIEIIEPVSRSLSDSVLAEAIKFWKLRFGMELLTAEERELLKSWPCEGYRLFRKLELTVDETEKRLRKGGIEIESETTFPESYGFYVKRAKSYLLYVGVWANAPAPLSLSLRTGSAIWLKPAIPPPGAVTSPKAPDHLFWPLEQEDWDNPERIDTKVGSFLGAYWPV